MKLTLLNLFALAAFANAAETVVDATVPAATTAAPTATTTAPKTSSAGSTVGSAMGPPTSSGSDPFASLKATKTSDSYHMKPVRVVQARAQGDAPVWKKDRFISSYFKDDMVKGYTAVMDNVNTASVEGALMFVQAECVNQNQRSAEDRCKRKNGVNYIVFYEMEIAQTNETIAQFQEEWQDTPEYGPMVPMDGGKCTPATGTDTPPECKQFNGVDDQPNLGAFVGGRSKADKRAPYTGNIWFSFPNSCPEQPWKLKDEKCRASTRKGLCDMGVAPNGVDCTFTYRILGYVPIDDIVGITSIPKEDGSNYKNFTEWCMASETNIEYDGDKATNEWNKGLPFWENPLDSKACDNRTTNMLEVYSKIVKGDYKSTQIPPEAVEHFVALPKPADLAKKNPKCYESVKACSTGCKRESWAQVCRPCTGSDCEKAPSDFKFPTLTKAPTKLSEDKIKSSISSGGSNKTSADKSGGGADGKKSSAAGVSLAVTSAVVVALASVFAL